MPEPLTRIESLYDTLGNAEKQVADFVNRHPDRVPFLSVQEIAKRADVSVATVSRLAGKLGYDSLKDFKIQLAQQPSTPISGMFEAIAPDDSDSQVVRKVFGGNIRSLEQTLEVLDERALIRAAKSIAGCKRVFLMGVGSSGNIARDAALRLSHLDIPVEATVESYDMVNRAARCSKQDVVLGISHSGRSTILVQAVQLARGNGATTVGISNYFKSPLHEACDLFLHTSFAETRVKVAALSSRVAQMCLIDALYLMSARYRKIDPQILEKLNESTERLLRSPDRHRRHKESQT
jgi:DNA-binding MurR/RpiR family transcriptional regulator